MMPPLVSVFISFFVSDHHTCQDDHRQADKHHESRQDPGQPACRLLAEIQLHPGIISDDGHLVVCFVIFVFCHISSFPAGPGKTKEPRS